MPAAPQTCATRTTTPLRITGVRTMRRYPPAPLQSLTCPLGLRTRPPLARDRCLLLHHFKVQNVGGPEGVNLRPSGYGKGSIWSLGYVCLWLQAEIRAMPPVRPLIPQERTFWARLGMSEVDPKETLVKFCGYPYKCQTYEIYWQAFTGPNRYSRCFVGS